MRVATYAILLIAAALAGALSTSPQGEDLVGSVMADCADEDCVREHVAAHIGLPPDSTPEDILKRVGRTLSDAREFRLQLPWADDATLVFRPRGHPEMDIEFPHPLEGRSSNKARDIMKNKMLLPLLMMVKMKLQALIPLMLTIIGIKATKALMLSKIAVLLVVGFLVVQLCQKLGMAKMSMSMGPSPPPADPTPVPMMYGPPTTSGYEPPPSGWEPSGPYSRVYDPTSAQQMAYNAYSQSSAYKA
ncbi:hypothetical protein AAG570_009347 [Ranatra chinensis]|uniref:Uncharacterized protein n=1 Tax=Ranatra chinensis TaxID=642074 RepID=A0ABD0YNV1_9HEMI